MDIELLNKLAKAYGLKGLKLVGRVKHGVLSNNYIVQASGVKYFLKHYRVTVAGRVQYVHQAKQIFYKYGVPVVLPLPTKSGVTYVKLGKDAYALFPYINSKQVVNGHELNTQQIQNVARMLAHMHGLSRQRLPKVASVGVTPWSAGYVKKLKQDFVLGANEMLAIIRAKKRKTQFDLQAERGLVLKLRLLNDMPIAFNMRKLGKPHFLHGDFHQRNVFFNPDNTVSHVFDFEKSDIQPRAFEVVRSINIIFFSEEFNIKNFRRAHIYLSAYCNVYTIPKSEIISAVQISYYRHILSLWIEREHYKNYDFRPDKFLSGNILYLKYFHRHGSEEFVDKIW